MLFSFSLSSRSLLFSSLFSIFLLCSLSSLPPFSPTFPLLPLPPSSLGEDFNLYSSESDYRSDANPWNFCNYDDANAAFPRDCGRDGLVGGRWAHGEVR